MKYKINMRSSGINESIIQVTLQPEAERDKQLIEGAKQASLN